MVLTLLPYLSTAQSGLEIIDYHETAKVISQKEFPVMDTPVIAIIDNGVNISHEDLSKTLWTNSHEIPDNGTDDDYYGWPMSVYPNPASLQTSIFVENKATSSLDIRIINLDGKSVSGKQTNIQKGFSTIPIDLQGISSGLHILEVSSSKTIKTAKILIQ